MKRIAIVTGDVGGLGLAIATRLVADGCRALIADRDPHADATYLLR